MPGVEEVAVQANIDYLTREPPATTASYATSPARPADLLTRLVEEATHADVEPSTVEFLSQQATIVERELAAPSRTSSWSPAR